MTARDIINVVVQTGAVKPIRESAISDSPLHLYVDWDRANTELILMFQIGLDTELTED